MEKRGTEYTLLCPQALRKPL